MAKMRKGFVSNSSSSSFIVIGQGPTTDLPYCEDDILTIDSKLGETEFGWQNERYNDSGSRVVFAWLQAKYKPEWMEMFEKVVKEHLGVSFIDCKLSDSWSDDGEYGYIDHQSAACECANTEMFISEYDLAQFLFASDSFIQCGNDNG
jgi:hypothetical protein